MTSDRVGSDLFCVRPCYHHFLDTSHAGRVRGPFHRFNLHPFSHSYFITLQFWLIRQEPYFLLLLPSRKLHYLQCVLFLCSEVTLVLNLSMEKIHDIAFTVSDDEFCASICSLSSRCGERRSQVHSQCPWCRTVSAARTIGRGQPQRGL